MPQLQSIEKLQSSPFNNRRHEREIVEAAIFIRQSNSQLFRAELSDLSVSGFKMISFTHLDERKPVYIRLPGIQTLSAKIKWSDYNDYGCAFADELHPAVLQHLVTKLREFE